jgi:hypothetical protein
MLDFQFAVHLIFLLLEVIFIFLWKVMVVDW